MTETFEFSVTFVGKWVYLFGLQFLTCVTESVTESVTELFLSHVCVTELVSRCLRHGMTDWLYPIVMLQVNVGSTESQYVGLVSQCVLLTFSLRLFCWHLPFCIFVKNI